MQHYWLSKQMVHIVTARPQRVKWLDVNLIPGKRWENKRARRWSKSVVPTWVPRHPKVSPFYLRGAAKFYKTVRFQVLTAANMKFRVFCDVAPCTNVEVDRRFRYAYCWWWRQYALLKRRSTSTWLHGATSHKSLNFYKPVCCYGTCHK
jgi:hypothetical protein